ncbi:MAG: hypothetical protein J4F37_14430 [Acidobacteria bacterium]|nr:hypothetical protein [Acidobacteriota bacterium]
MPLAALFVLALVAASCGDDDPVEPAAPAVDTAAVDAAQAEADSARAEAEAAAAAAAEAEAALAEAEAAAAAANAEQQAEAQAALEAAQAEAEAAMAAAAEAEARAAEAEMAAEEAAMAEDEMMEEEAAPTGDPGRVTIAVTTEPSTLDPQAVNDRSSRVVTANLFESLLGRDASTALVPVLATGYGHLALHGARGCHVP